MCVIERGQQIETEKQQIQIVRKKDAKIETQDRKLNPEREEKKRESVCVREIQRICGKRGRGGVGVGRKCKGADIPA